MKKLFLSVVLVGLATGAYFLLKGKMGKISSQPQRDYSKRSPKIGAPNVQENLDEINEMYGTKESNVQSVAKRHAEAASVMTDAFKNIMESLDPIENEDEVTDVVIETKDAETIQKLDLLSNELDELLQ